MAVYLIIFGAAVHADGTPSGTLARRVKGALLAAKAYSDPCFMPTGGQGANGYVEAIVMRNMLIAAGIPANRIIMEDKARDTLESVRRCDALLRRRDNVTHVEACTSRYHLPRCALLLRLMGWSVQIPHMPADYGKVSTRKLIVYVLKEILATPYDATLLIVTRVIGKRRP